MQRLLTAIFVSVSAMEGAAPSSAPSPTLQVVAEYDSTALRALVTLTFERLYPNATYRCRFSLPDEILSIQQWRAPNEVKYFLRKDKLQPGATLVNIPQFDIVTAKTSLDVSYSLAIGKQLATPHAAANGPHYGFASDTHAVMSSTLIAPTCFRADSVIPIPVKRIRGKAALPPYNLDITPNPGRTATDSALLVFGEFNSYTIKHSGHTLIVRTMRPLDTRLEYFLATSLGILRPLLAHARSEPTGLIVLSSDHGAHSYFPLASGSLLATDLYPLTEERALRFLRVFASQIASSNLDETQSIGSEELWLAYALPAFFSIQAASAAGLTDRSRSLYDRRELYLSAKVSFDSLSRLDTIDEPQRRDFMANTLGVLLLDGLNEALQRDSSSLSSVVSRSKLGSRLFSFFPNLAIALGPFDARAWWARQVRSADPDVPLAGRLVLEPIPAPAPVDSQMLSVLTAGLHGNLEMCGCKLNQAGGVARRAAAMRQVVQGVRRIDLGNFTPPAIPGAAQRKSQEIELAAFLRTMEGIDYDFIGCGPNEGLHWPKLAETSLSRLIVCGNREGWNSEREVLLLGMPVVLINWSDPPAVRRFDNTEVAATPALPRQIGFDRLLRRVEDLSAMAKHAIIVGHIHPLTIQALLSRKNSIAAILSTYDGSGTDLRTEGRIGDVYVHFYPGDEGATVLYLFGRRRAAALQVTHSVRRLMDASVESVPAVKRIVDAMYDSDQYRQAVLAEDHDASGPHVPARRALSGLGRLYVGSDRCKGCHATEYVQWQSTPHANAFKTLIERRRNHSPRCVSCHVVGFQEASGYTIGQKQQHLINVGCESCHGPGGAHVANASAARFVKVDMATCSSCHTPDHSAMPEKPQAYWKRILHVKSRG